MKSPNLVLLVAFSVSAMAGKPTKEQILSAASVEGNAVKQCGSGDPPRGPNVGVRKGLNPKAGNPCDDGVESRTDARRAKRQNKSTEEIGCGPRASAVFAVPIENRAKPGARFPFRAGQANSSANR